MIGSVGMIFSSLIFLSLFLPLSLALYYIAPYKYKNLILFLLSLLFYAWGEPIYVVIMIFSTVIDFINGQLIYYYPSKKKSVLISSLVINLGLLGFFKYSDFLIQNINLILNININPLNLKLPIGISFYTFQTVSYTIDVYYGNCKPQKNIINFGCYVAMFPQLIAGPIVRYVTIANQIDNRKLSINKFSEGVVIFIKGMSKKVLLANNIGMLWDNIYNYSISNLSTLSAWLGIIAFTFQIYFDFSGYSDMAIGLGKMFGFDFPQNFNFPYISTSVSEFWRRWHITLSTWFKEYVYIPLGGNKVSKLKNIRNILMVWLLTGIWHGASWNFAVWGLYFGFILIIEKFILNKYFKKIPIIFRWMYSIFLVIIGWVLFSFENLSDSFLFIGKLFNIGNINLVDSNSLYLLSSYSFILPILIIASTSILKNILEFIKQKNIYIHNIILSVACVIGLILNLAYIVDASYNPFLYFRF